MPTEEELSAWIRAVAEIGDRSAFAALFMHFAPRIKGLLVRGGANDELAEELSQETMVIVWRRASSFDPARAELSAWLYTKCQPWHSQAIHTEPALSLADKTLNGALLNRNADEERSRDLAVISHELRNSLGVIRNAARLLRSPASSGSIESARSLIERHVGQMSRHIEDLLEPQHRGARSDGLHRFPIDLRTIAFYAVDSIGPELTRRGHRLVVKLPEEPVWARVDGARLEQAFSNLLINAAKYTPDGGDISVLMERNAESVYVRIRDSGVGIEPAMLSRVFGMFVQVSTALPGRENGRGIGLAVVRSVVEQHGGTVTATSAGLGLGSEFTVVLPSPSAQRDSMIIAV